MSDDLILAIRLVENIKFYNTNFLSTYMFSNENINGFIKKISLNERQVLTVCSSGDQAFNLVLNGASKVDLFDINRFTKYYFYLKKAAIIGFFGFGSKLSGVIIPVPIALFAFSTYIRSFSITNFAVYELVNSRWIKVFTNISRAIILRKLFL